MFLFAKLKKRKNIYWSNCEAIKLYTKGRKAFKKEQICFYLEGNFEALLCSSFLKIFGKLINCCTTKS